MSRLRIFALPLLTGGLLLSCADAHAQARGPSAREVQEKGQDVGSSVPDWTPYLDTLARQTGIDRAELASGLSWTPATGFVLERDGERIPLGQLEPPPPPILDEAARAASNQQQRAWLARMVGRFRLGGRVEGRERVNVGISGGPPDFVDTIVGGDISGIADCAAVGNGPGVHCIFNASWPVIELTVATIGDRRLPASERVMLFQPAVLVVGLNPDTAEVRASMVTDDSIAHTWAGRLEADSLIARRTNNCLGYQALARPPPPCFQPLEISAGPNGTVTFVHRANGVTIRLNLQRDPAARAQKPMPANKAR